MRVSWTMVLVGALFASPASAASTSGTSLVRDLAFRVGPIVGAALVCRDIARSRLQIIVDKFHTLIREAAPQEAERADLAQVFDRSITDGTNQLTAGKSDCITAERRLSEFERSLSDQAFVTLAAALGPSSAAAATAPVAPVPQIVPAVAGHSSLVLDMGDRPR